MTLQSQLLETISFWFSSLLRSRLWLLVSKREVESGCFRLVVCSSQKKISYQKNDIKSGGLKNHKRGSLNLTISSPGFFLTFHQVSWSASALLKAKLMALSSAGPRAAWTNSSRETRPQRSFDDLTQTSTKKLAKKCPSAPVEVHFEVSCSVALGAVRNIYFSNVYANYLSKSIGSILCSHCNANHVLSADQAPSWFLSTDWNK